MASGAYMFDTYPLEQLQMAIINAYVQNGIAAQQCANLNAATQGMTGAEVYNTVANLDDYSLVQNALEDAYKRDMIHGMGVNASVATSAEVAAAEAAAALNSNTVSQAARTANVQLPMNYSKVGNNYVAKAGPLTALGATMPAWLGHVCCGVVGTGIGLKLGVYIDDLLYKANPDFWDSHNLSELNPQTWGDTTIGGGLLDWANYPQVPVMMDQNGQMYANQNLFALMAQYMAGAGFFGSGYDIIDWGDIQPGTLYDPTTAPTSIISAPSPLEFEKDGYTWRYVVSSGHPMSCVDEVTGYLYFASDEPFSYDFYFDGVYQWTLDGELHTMPDGQTVYGRQQTGIPSGLPIGYNHFDPDVNVYDVFFILANGEVQPGGIPEGVNQYDTIPQGITTDMDINDILDLLRQQYPELDPDKLTIGVLQPDGQIVPETYWPIGWPEGWPETQPTSVPANWPVIDPDNPGQTDKLPDALTPPVTDPGKGPGDGGDTGTGTPPAYVEPTGSADALYKIYNPSTSAIHSFGAWLWSPNFVDQILKMFSNPMEAIISLHKIYGTPHTSGSANIKVGYLDSGVSSPVVDQQYITVNCGTVNVRETYGSVFDYNPFTEVSLYLPFLGIVNLDVADVMRGAVTVVYHIDVITGAVLVEVKIVRDSGAGGVIYQYTGSCAEHYPLSAGSYMGIVTGAAGIAAGVAGTVLSGGALAPMLLSGAASIGAMHTNIQKSGGFSANAGAMGIKKPYFIISRPQSAMSKNYQRYGGIGANTYCKLGSCKGYTRVKYIILDNVQGATRQDLDAIELALKNGVIV